MNATSSGAKPSRFANTILVTVDLETAIRDRILEYESIAQDDFTRGFLTALDWMLIWVRMHERE